MNERKSKNCPWNSPLLAANKLAKEKDKSNNIRIYLNQPIIQVQIDKLKGKIKKFKSFEEIS
jgi:hypothetical protein